MTIIIDSSYLYALYNTSDGRSNEAQAFASDYEGESRIPEVVLPEVSYLFKRDFGDFGLSVFLTSLNSMIPPLESLSTADLLRTKEIEAKYADSKFDFVDCCIMALAERLQITRIATFDRRDFSIFRPRHCDFLELLP